VASLIAATLYQGHLIGTTNSICRCCWTVATYTIESSHWKNVNDLCRADSFLSGPHCQYRGVCQGMQQTYLYMWYPLFQTQWDRCDQQNNQTYNYLVKRHHLYRGT
jgi:hypothetical protein